MFSLAHDEPKPPNRLKDERICEPLSFIGVLTMLSLISMTDSTSSRRPHSYFEVMNRDKARDALWYLAARPDPHMRQ